MARPWAVPVKAITWQNLSPVSRDPGIVMPGSRLRFFLAIANLILLFFSEVPGSRLYQLAHLTGQTRLMQSTPKPTAIIQKCGFTNGESLYGGQFTLSTPLIKPNFCTLLPHRSSITVSLETTPFFHLQ